MQKINKYNIIVLIAFFPALLNSTMIYDDLYLVNLFQQLVTKVGIIEAIQNIFFAYDLGPGQFRLYGISRLIHFFLYLIVGNNFYLTSLFIIFSQIFTSLILYKLFINFKIDSTASRDLSFVYLFSPFIFTNTFHHYSYLILPVQISIIAFYLLINDKLNYYLIPFFGIFIALTGESHLIPVLFCFFLTGIYFVKKNNNNYRKIIVLIIFIIITVILYYYLRLFYLGPPTDYQRYLFNFINLHQLFSRSLIFWNSLLLGFYQQIFPLLNQNFGFFLIFLLFLFIIFLNKKCRTSTPPLISSKIFVLSLIIFLFSISTILVTSIFTDQLHAVLPRRYCYIPLTILSMSIYLYLKISKYTNLLSNFLLVLIFGSYFYYQIVAIPIIRAEDNLLIEKIKIETRNKPNAVVVFQNSWDTFNNSEDFDPGLPGIRGSIPEIFESYFSGYRWQMLYVKLFSGAKNSAAYFKKIKNDQYEFTAVGLLEPRTFIASVDDVILVKNFSNINPPWLEALHSVKVFGNLSNLTLLPAHKYFLSDLSKEHILGSYAVGSGIATIRLNENNKIIITNETLSIAEGLIDGNLLAAKSWNVTGKFSIDGEKLFWSNGVTWFRK